MKMITLVLASLVLFNGARTGFFWLSGGGVNQSVDEAAST